MPLIGTSSPLAPADAAWIVAERPRTTSSCLPSGVMSKPPAPPATTFSARSSSSRSTSLIAGAPWPPTGKRAKSSWSLSLTASWPNWPAATDNCTARRSKPSKSISTISRASALSPPPPSPPPVSFEVRFNEHSKFMPAAGIEPVPVMDSPETLPWTSTSMPSSVSSTISS